MGAPLKDTRALKELYKTVKRLQNDHTLKDVDLHTPYGVELKDVDLHTPYGVENDCLVPALWCFVDNLEKINVKSKYISIITSRMPKRINQPYDDDSFSLGLDYSHDLPTLIHIHRREK
ncbi:hypothetical protein EOD39_1795 [Acipenser ruthenus]|uniref:Uncharacterized protein n=1 Tax=Acipenser ruthenus TaxID=7906 RepID=A0A444U7H1_ACIRT|nr:hypothetical protein EOD39_1795 [Acipenser ruthenus]